MEDVSILRRLGRYLVHGLVLGIVTFVSFFSYYFLIHRPVLNLPSPVLVFTHHGMPLLGATLHLGITLASLGGVNELAVCLLWGKEQELDVGKGLRDGFTLYVTVQLLNLPAAMVLLPLLTSTSPNYNLSLGLGFLLPLSIIYCLVYGIVGRWIHGVFAQETKMRKPE